MASQPWARPHDTGQRVKCENCGEQFGPLGPGRQLCAPCRIQWGHATNLCPTLTLDEWLYRKERAE